MTDTDIQAVDPPAPDANALAAEQVAAAPAESSPAVKEPDDTEPPKQKGVQKRLDELTRNWREAERREQTLLDLLKQQRETAPPPAPTAVKTLADFDYDEGKYQAHLLAEVERRAAAAAERQLREQQERVTAERRQSTFRQRSAEFAKTVEDFETTVFDPSLLITATMAEVIQDSDDGPAIIYHLGKNPDVAMKIAQLPPQAAAREIGRIEARLEYERERAKAKPTVSQAPPPPPKIDAADPAVEKDPDQMSTDDWLKWREKQLRKRKQ